MKKVFILLIFFFVLVSCDNSNNPKEDSKSHRRKTVIPNIEYNLKQTHPHDITSFTEGFEFYENKLFESTGSPENLPFTNSLFGVVDLNNGKISELGRLDKNIYFGEGITLLDGKLFQLTYLSQTCFVYDAQSFKPIGSFKYENKEGWGLTTDGEFLIMSDGTNVLTYLNPDNFQVARKLNVTQNRYVVDYLNELEFIKGYIYANIWTKNHIVKIDTSSGNVVGILNLNPFFEEAKNTNPGIGVMNGIAYDSISSNLFITGKLWPFIFELDFYH